MKGNTGVDELHGRRAAVAALGHELRVLVDAAVRTGAPDETLRRAAEEARLLAERLSVRCRTRAELPSVDRPWTGPRMYSPVSGAGSPVAPPVRMEAVDHGFVGTCTLGLAHEGPPGYVHGGVSAMLLDELMGRACTSVGPSAMTVGLELRYRRPVPLETPLRLVAVVTGVEGRKRIVHGSIAASAEPDVALVEAEGTFLVLRPDQESALFAGVRPVE
ncbi:PaaI family thioesterase [Streptomyces sp. cg40]|uniref:PaaI family thioesterase n=1 Tax=Streptomyces sp. cg40 TaxID=3419764 RepID=UPI003CFF04E4